MILKEPNKHSSFVNLHLVNEQIDKLYELGEKLEHEPIGKVKAFNETYSTYAIDIKQASEVIQDSVSDLYWQLNTFYENESDMLNRNMNYLFKKIDDSKDFYIRHFPSRENLFYNERFIADYIVDLLYQADKRETPQGYNHNSATSYIRRLINIDYNNFKKGLPSVLDLTANGVEFNNKPYVDHKKTHVNE